MRLTGGLSRTMFGLMVLLAMAVAGLTHAVSVLALPWHSRHDAFARVAAMTPLDTRVALPVAGVAPVPFRDPAMLAAVCRYDLRVHAFQVALSPFDSGFVTLGFHSRHGLAFYGLTVRATDATDFDMVLTDKPDTDQRPDARQHVITVQAPEPDGFVLIATPAGDGTEAAERLDHVGCGPAETPASAG